MEGGGWGETQREEVWEGDREDGEEQTEGMGKTKRREYCEERR